ncbi:hypothetical protein WBG78_25160 [Chryseolinea sp. T2]|uniref:hypothetical protein n=1 Tax=Chryseolinea sp. T2 TaxID=3129255 RepID=UPI00307796C5
MKYNLLIKGLIIVTALAIAGLLTSCEQEDYQPATSVMPGGGTVTTYKAYTLGAADPGGENIHGRIVFYKYSSTVTLVQMGLYNTDPDTEYASEIYIGALIDGSSTVSKALDKVNGESGGFTTYKYFTIKDETFFDGLDAYDANVRVKLGATVVAAGDIGSNAEPVDVSE